MYDGKINYSAIVNSHDSSINLLTILTDISEEYVRKVRRSKVTTVHCKLTSGVMTVTK